MKEIELTSVGKDTHPDYFYEGSSLNFLNDTSGIYTAKDFSEIIL